MNNIKNTIILTLSVIIIIQSAFLLYFMKQGPRFPKKAAQQAAPSPKPIAKRPPVVVPAEKEKPKLPLPNVKPAAITGKIVLVLDDWGYNLKNRDFITNNDFHVTLSILPFRPYSSEVAELAHQSNKDVIVHMPMEPKNKENFSLENNTILTTMDAKTVENLMGQAFSSVSYAKGISNHMGSKATEDTRLMKIVMGYLKKGDLFFLDSFVTNKSVCRSLARSFHVGFIARDVFIDNEANEDYIRQQMVKLAKVSKQKGVAVGIGHDRPTTIAALNKIIPELEVQGFKFVNISEVVDN